MNISSCPLVRGGLAVIASVLVGFQAFAGQFRSISAVPEMIYGSVSSFELTIGPSAGTNPLYMAWGATDGGDTTAGWTHVEKLRDIGPSATTVSVPISQIPEWGMENCKAVRFFLLPGDMYSPVEYLQNTASNFVELDYFMNSEDVATCEFRLNSTTSQYGGHLFGYKKNWANQFYCCYGGSALMDGGVNDAICNCFTWLRRNKLPPVA